MQSSAENQVPRASPRAGHYISSILWEKCKDFFLFRPRLCREFFLFLANLLFELYLYGHLAQRNRAERLSRTTCCLGIFPKRVRTCPFAGLPPAPRRPGKPRSRQASRRSTRKRAALAGGLAVPENPDLTWFPWPYLPSPCRGRGSRRPGGRVRPRRAWARLPCTCPSSSSNGRRSSSPS